MDPAATLLANPVNPMLCTTKIVLITQSSQLYNIPLDGKTNFGSVQHRISSWMSHLSGRQACPIVLGLSSIGFHPGWIIQVVDRDAHCMVRPILGESSIGFHPGYII